MTRSQIIANWNARSGTEANHAVVLTDAVILFLAVSQSMMDRIMELLGHHLIESALSDDGFCFAAILSPNDWELCLDEVAGEVDGLKFNDSRNHPCNNLGDFVRMVSLIEQTRQLAK